MYNSAAVFDKGFEPFQDESIMKSILAQYERVLVESLVTTFGLDFIVKDQYGGDAPHLAVGPVHYHDGR